MQQEASPSALEVNYQAFKCVEQRYHENQEQTIVGGSRWREKCWVLGHSKQKGACYYACSFCSFAKKKFVLHSPLKEPKGQTHKKSDIYASQLACLLAQSFCFFVKYLVFFVLAIFRSQKDNKHSCAILLFLIFLGTKWNNKKLSCTLCLQNFLGSKQNY